MWSTNQNWFQTWLQQKLSEHKQKHFASPSKNAEYKNKYTKKKKKRFKAFCVSSKHSNTNIDKPRHYEQKAGNKIRSKTAYKSDKNEIKMS